MHQSLKKTRPNGATRMECDASLRSRVFPFWALFGIWSLVFPASISPLLAFRALAQAPLPVYSDRLVNGFQNWGWATLNYTNASPVHSGTASVAVTMTNGYQGQQVYHPDLNSSNFTSLSFWINGGPTGGQKLQVYGLLHILTTNNAGSGQYFSLGTLQTNVWQQFVIPLSAIGVANKTNFTGFVIQDRSGAPEPTFYVDDVQLLVAPAPSLVHLSLNATQTVRTADWRWFGVNAAIWDKNFDTPQTVSLLQEMGARILRFPGGSLSDEYHWASNTSYTNTWQWDTSFAKFVHVATNVGVQSFITVNYGSGTATEAANWVRNANVTNHYGFKYWEIGNENYGTWETDSNSFPHDPFTYASRATNYFIQMRAADPSIKIGVVVVTGEDSNSNGYNSHPATNSITGQAHNGWTPVVLTTLKNAGIMPDFVIYHVYPEYTGQESDSFLLQYSSNWARDAADLRQQITAYLGPSGTNIELICTENNSNSGNQGKQSTSLVNGLYYSDSLSQLMKTEFNGFVWWDLRNGTDTNGSFDTTLYGWRTNGDLGVIGGLSTRYPPFYAAKLIQNFVHSGDNILNPSSDYSLLSAYASRTTNGAVNLLVLNKDTTTNFNAQISLAGYVPNSIAAMRTFGIPQDEAARTNASLAVQDIALTNYTFAATNFGYSFPALSQTLFTFSPAAPQLAVLSSTPSQFIFQLRGQSGVRYILQTSTNLTSWRSVSSNTLTSPTLNFTNPISSATAPNLWRALWQP